MLTTAATKMTGCTCFVDNAYKAPHGACLSLLFQSEMPLLETAMPMLREPSFATASYHITNLHISYASQNDTTCRVSRQMAVLSEFL